MFEEGNLLFFRPFLFKNGEPQDKFFLVLKKLDGDILLASLPTSKDHVPSDLEVKHGCLNISERMFMCLYSYLEKMWRSRKMEHLLHSRKIHSFMVRIWMFIR